jgi:hypothetical protein
MHYSTALEWANKRYESLQLRDFNSEVVVEHQDGSKFLFKYATAEVVENSIWLAVMSEHQTTMIFSLDDCKVAISTRIFKKEETNG